MNRKIQILMLAMLTLSTTTAAYTYDNQVSEAHQEADYLLVTLADEGSDSLGDNPDQITWKLYKDGNQLWSGDFDPAGCLSDLSDDCSTDALWAQGNADGNLWYAISRSEMAADRAHPISAQDGDLTPFALEGDFAGAALVGDDLVVLAINAGEISLTRYNQDGSQDWSELLVGSTIRDFDVKDDRIIVAATTRNVIIDLNDGTEYWHADGAAEQVALGNEDTWALTLDTGRFQSYDNKSMVFALKPTETGYDELFQQGNHFFAQQDSKVYKFPVGDQYEIITLDQTGTIHPVSQDYWYISDAANLHIFQLEDEETIKSHTLSNGMSIKADAAWHWDDKNLTQQEFQHNHTAEIAENVTTDMEYQLNLTNVGDFESTIQVSAGVQEGIQANFNQTEVTLKPGMSTSVGVNFTSNLLADQYSIVILTQSEGHEETMELNLTVSEKAAGEFRNNPDQLEAEAANTTYQYILQVENTGNINLTTQLMHNFTAQYADAWTIEYEANITDLAPGDVAVIPLNITTPTMPEELSPAELNITAAHVEENFTLSIRNEVVIAAHLTSDETNVESKLNETTEVQLILTNIGNVQYEYNLRVTFGDGELDLNEVLLAPGASETLTLSVEVPDHPYHVSVTIYDTHDNILTKRDFTFVAEAEEEVVEEEEEESVKDDGDKESPGLPLIALLAALGVTLIVIRRKQ